MYCREKGMNFVLLNVKLGGVPVYSVVSPNISVVFQRRKNPQKCVSLQRLCCLVFKIFHPVYNKKVFCCPKSFKYFILHNF